MNRLVSQDKKCHSWQQKKPSVHSGVSISISVSASSISATVVEEMLLEWMMKVMCIFPAFFRPNFFCVFLVSYLMACEIQACIRCHTVYR